MAQSTENAEQEPNRNKTTSLGVDALGRLTRIYIKHGQFQEAKDIIQNIDLRENAEDPYYYQAFKAKVLLQQTYQTQGRVEDTLEAL
jgi:hypothetical protein